MLTDKERAFCVEYVSNGKNATRAYMAVNPSVKYESARTYGGKMAKKPEVRAEIDRLTNEQTSSKIMSYEQCLEELTKIALTASDSLKIKAIAEIGKMKGYTSQNININQKTENALDNMTKEELMELVKTLGDDDNE